jgi:ribonuclease HII
MAPFPGCQKTLSPEITVNDIKTAMTRFPLDREYGNLTTTGCDEVGRGCLAGPVVTACVSWKPEQVAKTPLYQRLRDSKELTSHRRMAIYQDILSLALRVRVAVISHITVDQLNVLRATLLGFEMTAPAHSTSDYLFIDGNQKPLRLPWAKTVIKGENKLSAIAGASVIAKVIRDEIMHAAACVYPHYGFDRHVGYPTAKHKDALRQTGPCPLHRKSFKPVHPFVLEYSGKPHLLTRILAEKNPAALKELWSEYTINYFQFSPGDDRRILDHFTREEKNRQDAQPGK